MRLIVQVGIVLAIIAGAVGVFYGLVLTEPEAAVQEVAEREWIVDTTAVEIGSVEPTLRLTGRIVSARDAELRSLAAGRIVEVGPSFYAGGVVKQGELLVAVDRFDYEADVLDAEAAMLEAKASLAETEAELKSNQALAGFDAEEVKLRKREVDRKQKLTGRGVVSAKSMDDASIAYLGARQTRVARQQTIARLKAEVDRLKASTTRAGVRLSRAERRLEETRLLAPFDGVLVDVSAAIGKRVGDSDRIARIVDRARLEARFHVSDAQYGRLTAAGGVKGRPAEIIWRTGAASIRLQAMLERVQGEFDAASGGVWVYAPILNSENVAGLRPGAFVEAETPDVRYPDAARLPEGAVHDSARVYVLTDGRLVEREVKVLGRDRGDVVVAGDLQAGEQVVTTRIPEIGPGLKARRRDQGA